LGGKLPIAVCPIGEIEIDGIAAVRIAFVPLLLRRDRGAAVVKSFLGIGSPQRIDARPGL
jgi:hypothetical protein